MKDLFNYIVKLKYTYADDDFLVLIIQSFLRKPETASWTEAAVRIREARNGLSLWGIWLWWRATVNEICGGAIIWQLVCNGLLLLNVNTKGSHWSFLSGTRCPGTREHIPDTIELRKHVYPSSLLRRGVARRNRLWNATSPDSSRTAQIVPTCPACTTGISRWEARKKRAVRCGKKRERKKEEKIWRKRSLYRIIGWLLVTFWGRFI